MSGIRKALLTFLVILALFAIIPILLFVRKINADNGHTLLRHFPEPVVAGGTDLTTSKDIASRIHIAISIDEAELKGALALIQSIKKHCTANKNFSIVIHIVVSTENRTLVESKVSCTIQLPRNLEIEFHSFDVPHNIRQLIRAKDQPYLKSTANFARLMLDRIFFSLPYILYVDADTIIRHDLSKLWKQIVHSDRLLLAVPRNRRYKTNFKEEIEIYFENRYKKKFDGCKLAFNAGIVGINLEKWRRKNITNEIIYWMKLNAEHELWVQGTQPLLLLVAYGDWKSIDKRWNVEGLGLKYTKKRVNSAYLLHWNGPYKPWAKLRLSNGTVHQEEKNDGKKFHRYDYLWNEYNVPECSGHGMCLDPVSSSSSNNNTVISTWFCSCERGFTGHICDKTY